MSSPDFMYRFEPASDPAQPYAFLMLHGTGGDENDLIPLGHALAPGAALLSVRGKVMEGPMPRFFRRFDEGVFDVEDLIFRAEELAGFLNRACQKHSLDSGKLIAVGYSNGANMAASLMLLHPNALAGAVMFRAMLPLETSAPDLSGKLAFLGAGRFDPITPIERVTLLEQILKRAGADVTLNWQETGHGLTQNDFVQARRWLNEKTLVLDSAEQ